MGTTQVVDEGGPQAGQQTAAAGLLVAVPAARPAGVGTSAAGVGELRERHALRRRGEQAGGGGGPQRRAAPRQSAPEGDDGKGTPRRRL